MKPPKQPRHPAGSGPRALHQQFEAILARSTDPGLEGLWIDRVGRDEPVYID